MSDYTPTTDAVRATYLGGTLIEFREEGFGRFQRWLAAHDREVAARTLRDAVQAARAAREGHWNLRDPRDPEVSYSVDRWLEVRADRIEKGELT